MSNVPTSDKERQSLKTMISEMTICLSKIDEQREQMKEIGGGAAETFDIPKKLINRMARIMFKHSYADLCAENDHFVELYETVIENKKVA